MIRTLRDSFHKPDETQHLARKFAKFCPDPDVTELGLHELMCNAVEHGILGIGHDEKLRLLESNALADEIFVRLSDVKNKERHATISYRKTRCSHLLVIRDPGSGFDWRRFLEFDAERTFDPSGRGIAIAASIPGARLRYFGNGNTVAYRIRVR